MSEKIKFYKKTSSVSAPTSADNGVHFIKPNGENEKFTIEVVDKGKKYVPDYIPLSGTVEGKPITGTMVVDLPNTMQPLFKRSVVRGNLSTEDTFIFDNHLYYVSEKSVTDQNYSLTGFAIIGQNDPSKPDNMLTQIGHSKWHSTDDSQKYTAIIGMYRGLGNADFSSGFTSSYSMDELRPTDDNMFVQRSYVDSKVSNFPLPTNWTNPSQRFSGLEDKGADATYNKVMVLDSNGKAGMKDIDYAIPYVGAKKSIDLNTQNLRIGGDFDKSYSTFERSQLDPKETFITHFTRLTDVASLSIPNDTTTQTDCIVITLPIKTSTRWVMEVDIFTPNNNYIFGSVPTKLLIGAYSTSNTIRSVNAISGADNVKSVSFSRDANNNTVIIIRPSDDYTSFPYGRVNIANFYHSVVYNEALSIKSNYKVEAVLESSLTGLTTRGTITNAQFNRDSYYLDFRNFTNVPNFAQASNVFAKNEATNWTNPSQQFSGLVDKSDDATYDKVMVLDADGKAGTKDTGDLGKVKTVNGQEPNENGDIEIEDSEFVKNGEGWSLKYRVDTPSFYGTIGKDAIDLSVATAASTVEGYEYGANGLNSIVFGVNNSAMGNGSFVAGSSNKSQGSSNHIIGSYSTIIENKGTATSWSCVDNGIYSGASHEITNVNSSVIIGGLFNKITGDENPGYGSRYSENNIIIGGYDNKIFLNPDAGISVKSSSILGGEVNKAQGYYNIVGGQYNHAVTVGETLFGLCGTIQNTSLKGYDTLDTENPIENTRIFNIGIGREINQHNIIRKDGLSVFRHGLVTAPSLTKELINSNPKSVVTKEYLNSDTLIDILTNSTPEQINQIKTLLDTPN